MKPSKFRPVAIVCGVAAILALAPTWFTFQVLADQKTYSASGFGLTGIVPGQDHSPSGAIGVLMVFLYVVAAIALLVIPPDDKAALVLAAAGLIATGVLLVDHESTKVSGVSLSWPPFVAAAIWLVAVVACRRAQPVSTTPRRP
jgi:hypothetical protein